MNPLELRKIIVVGARADAPEGVALLGFDGLPTTALSSAMVLRVAFWVPAKRPYQRCAGITEAVDARPFEVQALKDGAILEHVEDLEFPAQPSLEEMRRRLLPVWEGLTAQSLGLVPNAVPVDLSPNPTIQFTAIP